MIEFDDVVLRIWAIFFLAAAFAWLRHDRLKKELDEDRFLSDRLDARAADRKRKKNEPAPRVVRKPLPGFPKPVSGFLTLKPCEQRHDRAHTFLDEARYVCGISVVFLGDDPLNYSEFTRSLQGTISIYLSHLDLMLGTWPISVVMTLQKAVREPVFAFDEPLIIPPGSMIDIHFTNGPTVGEAKLMWILHGTSVRVARGELSSLEADHYTINRVRWPGPVAGPQPRESWPGFQPGREKF